MLGPAEFIFCGRGFTRRDFNIRNARDMKVVCSMWEPVAADRPNALLPCVIYMHGNSSARPEALTIISLVLSLGATLFTFDFCGSGLSDGSHVSLGVNEKDDLQAAIEYLRAQGTTSYIALWGRSMGAGTALLHGERDPSIAGMVLDSCYADLTTLAEEMVERGRQAGLFAPGMLVRMALSFIRSTIQKTAGFDIKDVSPIKGASKCFIPAMFVSARGDDFVTPHHSESICEIYGGDHNLVKVDGDHNSNRPYFLFQSAGIFLSNTLMLPEAWGLPDAANYIGGVRPWETTGHDTGPAGRRGPKLKPYFVGMDEDDAALERVLALSLMEHANVQSNSQAQARARAQAQQLAPALVGSDLSPHSDISGAGGVDLGMTRQRQQDVHQAIYSMFGGTASSSSSAGAGAGSSAPASDQSNPNLRTATDGNSGQGLPVILEYGETTDVGSPGKPGSTPSFAAASSSKKAFAAGRSGSGSGSSWGGVDSGAVSGSLSAPVSQAESEGSLDSVLVGATGAEVLAGSDDGEGRIGVACAVCTLLNSPNVRFCAACNSALIPIVTESLESM
jgi:pimeloyl-ACP methyl ester carboxylesterase